MNGLPLPMVFPQPPRSLFPRLLAPPHSHPSISAPTSLEEGRGCRLGGDVAYAVGDGGDVACSWRWR